VLLPTVARRGRSEAGIDSVAEFRGLMRAGHPRFETPRSAPVPQAFLPVSLWGWAMAIFISDNPATAEVCLCPLEGNLGLNVIFCPVGQLPGRSVSWLGFVS